MKRSAGFTLIELVIVIVILGILGAVAAPKLFNLQGDAYGANLNAMKGNISTAMTLANAKAQISGIGLTNTTSTDVPEYAGIEFIAGYPVADKDSTKTDPKGILATLDSFDYDRYTIAEVSSSSPTAITITPNAVADGDNCKITYTQAVKKSAASGTEGAEGYKPAIEASSQGKVEVVTTGC